MSGPDEQPFPESICHRCEALKKVKGANSVFLMCTALPDKYPRQPVSECPAFREKKPGG